MADSHDVVSHDDESDDDSSSSREEYLGTFLKLPSGKLYDESILISNWRRRDFYKKGNILIWKEQGSDKTKGSLDLSKMSYSNIDTYTHHPTNWSKKFLKITQGYGWSENVKLAIIEINEGDFDNANFIGKLIAMTNDGNKTGNDVSKGGRKFKKNRKSKKIRKLRKNHKSKKIRKTNRHRKFSRKFKH